MRESTFVVKVMYHQNHTIQGEVLWVQARQKEYFRSELELIHLMSGALGDDAAEKASIGRQMSYGQRQKAKRKGWQDRKGEDPDG